LEPSERYKDLIELNQQMHANGASGFNGSSLINVICQIGVLLQQFKCASVLDYGCGRGDAQQFFRVDALWNVRYAGYDPAVEMFAVMPEGQFDAVICTDALEHIPEEDLVDWVFDELFSKATKFVFIKVPTYEVDQWLPDGTNVHCTVKPREWWEEQFKKFSEKHGVPFAAIIKTLPTAEDEKGATI
jgi:hypothetical protein